MSLRERLVGTPSGSDSDDTEEQLADDIDPKGERRQEGFFTSYIDSIYGRDETSRARSTSISADASVAPQNLNTRYKEYVQTKPLVKSPLTLFGDAVTEPGWDVSAEINGETDEEMEEALDLWGSNCAVHAQQTGQDIMKIVEVIPELRRGKGTVFVEKAGTKGDGDSLGGLMLLDPTTIKIYSRERQPILIQPDDDVDPKHPRTDAGDAAAYVQYDESLEGYDDKEPIPFSADELIKITFDPDEGDAWGTPLWVQIREHIDGLYQKLRDRNASIRINGHPWRIISSENWDYDQAKRFLTEHFEEEISTWAESETKEKHTFAGRMDAIPHNVNVDEKAGNIPDIQDAVMDDVQAIFAVMPVSRFKIAYEEDINQFVVEPQAEKDERNAVKERQVIREHLEPVFQEKADELAGGEYEGEVEWKLEQPTDENPLERESFDADAFATSAKAFIDSGAPMEVVYWLAGVDSEQFEYSEEDAPSIDEADAAVQEAADRMGISSGSEDTNGDVGGGEE